MLDDGNTMLADATLEKLTLLRINRGFMEFMREHYKPPVAPGLQDDGRAREGQQRRRHGGGGGGKVDPL